MNDANSFENIDNSQTVELAAGWLSDGHHRYVRVTFGTAASVVLTPDVARRIGAALVALAGDDAAD